MIRPCGRATLLGPSLSTFFQRRKFSWQSPYVINIEMLRFYGPVNPVGLCRAGSLHNYSWQAYSFKRLTSIVHILSPETATALLNQRKGQNHRRICFMNNSPWKNVAEPEVVESAAYWLPVGRASNWATEAGASCEIISKICLRSYMYIYYKNQTGQPIWSSEMNFSHYKFQSSCKWRVQALTTLCGCAFW